MCYFPLSFMAGFEVAGFCPVDGKKQLIKAK